MSVTPFTAKGATGEITFTGTSVQIRRTGMLGAMRQLTGAGRGDKDIPISSVTGVRLEKGSTFGSKPFCQIIHSGALETQGGGSSVADDDNSVFFSSKSFGEFEQLRDLIMGAIAKGAPTGGGATDSAELLGKLAALRDTGVLTEDEFAAKKAEILTRL